MKKNLLSKTTKIIVVILLVVFVSGFSHKEEGLASTLINTLNKRTKTTNCKLNGSLPDAKCTPGAVMTTDLTIICYTSTKNRRKVTSATITKVYKQYNIKKPVKNTGKNQKYEVDHLIPLELGGSNDIANLFPEPASPKPGFREKDKVENYLHKQVCNGAMPIEEAQYGIATNWIRYYILLTTGTLPDTQTNSTLISTTTIIITTPPPIPTPTLTPTPATPALTPDTLPAPAPLPTPTPPTPSFTSEPQVKKSTTGICHEKGTTYYSRTTNFTPYNSIQECLNSGGRLPLR